MNMGQVNTLGGTCELLGLVTVAWGLVDLARYRGHLTRLQTRLHARWRTVVATVQRLLRRPGRVVHMSGSASVGVSGHASIQVIRGPFTPTPGLSLADQIAELVVQVNRLLEDLNRQEQRRDETVRALRKQMDDKLQTERARADAAVNAVGEELAGLREKTTGGLRLQLDGFLGVLGGVIFTTWPQGVAAWLPSWLPFRVVIVVVFFYACLRALFAWTKRYDARVASGQISPGQNWLRDSLKRAAGSP
jgi:hypothetical protein